MSTTSRSTHDAAPAPDARGASPAPAGIRVLSLLDEHGALGITALAAADRCSQPTMSGTVSALTAHGWVDKQPNPADARGSVVTLTDLGRSELRRVRVEYGATVADRFTAHPDHTPDDLATAVAVLRDLLDTDLTKGTL